MTMRNQKKSEKRELGKDRCCSQMGKVGTGLNTWDRWDCDRGMGGMLTKKISKKHGPGRMAETPRAGMGDFACRK